MKTILVPVDFSDATPKVISTARQLAEALGARIVLLHIVEGEPAFVGFEPGPATVRTAVADDFHHEHRQLEKLKESLAGLEVLALQIQGATAEKILQEAAGQQADMIVLGSHGHGALFHLLAGSVATTVLRETTCPVLVVPVRFTAAQ